MPNGGDTQRRRRNLTRNRKRRRAHLRCVIEDNGFLNSIFLFFRPNDDVTLFLEFRCIRAQFSVSAHICASECVRVCVCWGRAPHSSAHNTIQQIHGRTMQMCIECVDTSIDNWIKIGNLAVASVRANEMSAWLPMCALPSQKINRRKWPMFRSNWRNYAWFIELWKTEIEREIGREENTHTNDSQSKWMFPRPAAAAAVSLMQTLIPCIQCPHLLHLQTAVRSGFTVWMSSKFSFLLEKRQIGPNVSFRLSALFATTFEAKQRVGGRITPWLCTTNEKRNHKLTTNQVDKFHDRFCCGSFFFWLAFCWCITNGTHSHRAHQYKWARAHMHGQAGEKRPTEFWQLTLTNGRWISSGSTLIWRAFLVFAASAAIPHKTTNQRPVDGDVEVMNRRWCVCVVYVYVWTNLLCFHSIGIESQTLWSCQIVMKTWSALLRWTQYWICRSESEWSKSARNSFEPMISRHFFGAENMRKRLIIVDIRYETHAKRDYPATAANPSCRADNFIMNAFDVTFDAILLPSTKQATPIFSFEV